MTVTAPNEKQGKRGATSVANVFNTVQTRTPVAALQKVPVSSLSTTTSTIPLQTSTTTSTTTPTTPAAAPITTSSASPTSTGSAHHHSGLNAAQGFGIGFSVGIVLISLIAVGIVIYRRSRMKGTSIRDTIGQALRRSDSRRGHTMDNMPRRRISKSQRSRLVDSTQSTAPVLGYTEQYPVINSLDSLPQPMAHEDLRQALTQLCNSIKNFTDNFFHDEDVAAEPLDDVVLVALAGQREEAPWSEVLASGKTRTAALRCFLAQVIFRHMDNDVDPSRSLLPPSVFWSYASIMAREDARAQIYLRATWRQITAYLLREKGNQTIDTADSCRTNISNLANDIFNAGLPIRKDKDRFLSVLESILDEAAVLAFKLFSQEDEWALLWTSSRPGVVVFPRLFMTRYDPRTGNTSRIRVLHAVTV